MYKLKSGWQMNVFFTVVATVILILGDTLFSFFTSSYDLQPKAKNLVAAAITFYLVSMLRQKKTKIIVLSCIVFLMFIEMAHLSYYGTMFEPLEAWLFFNDFQEVANVFIPDAPIFFGAFMTAMFVFVSFYFLVKKTHANSSKHLAAGIILLLVYTLPPVASAMHGSKFWKGATMDTFTFNASYRALGDFVVRVLPEKLYGKEALLSKNMVEVNNTAEKVKGHVVLIIGESLNSENMQLYGYPRKTTPFLMTLRNKENFIYKKGISCGVFTSTSLSFLLNATCHEHSYDELVLRQKCIFKLAKDKGYQTSFISGQTFSQQKTIVNFICPNAIDVRFNKPEGAKGFYDQDMLKVLDDLDWSKPQFVVMQMRGSHAPYDTYPPSQTIFNSGKEGRKYKVRDKYDNTVAYSDQFLKEAFHKLRSLSQEPIYVLFTSDHGEQLGEENKYGHGFISKPVVTVPILYYVMHQDRDMKNPFPEQDYISHILATKQVLNLMGYTYSPKYEFKKLFIMGPDIEGGSGYALFDADRGELNLVNAHD